MAGVLSAGAWTLGGAWTLAGMTLHAFVDESARWAYLPAACVLAPEEPGPVRALTRGLRLGGERRVHLQSESE
jgi:hypothetical protein